MTLAKKTGSNPNRVQAGWISLSNGYLCNYRSVTALDAHGKSDCYMEATNEYLETFCISDALFGGYKAWRCDRY